MGAPVPRTVDRLPAFRTLIVRARASVARTWLVDSAAFGLKSSHSHRRAIARGQLSWQRASGRTEVAGALRRQIYNAETEF